MQEIRSSNPPAVTGICDPNKSRAQHHRNNSLSFKIIDKANSKFDLRIKEALHTNWRKPNLNVQQNHLALTLSL